MCGYFREAIAGAGRWTELMETGTTPYEFHLWEALTYACLVSDKIADEERTQALEVATRACSGPGTLGELLDACNAREKENLRGNFFRLRSILCIGLAAETWVADNPKNAVMLPEAWKESRWSVLLALARQAREYKADPWLEVYVRGKLREGSANLGLAPEPISFQDLIDKGTE